MKQIKNPKRCNSMVGFYINIQGKSNFMIKKK